MLCAPSRRHLQCGRCPSCLHPQWKKACETRRSEQVASGTAVMPKPQHWTMLADDDEM